MKKINFCLTRSNIEKIIRRYHPENDLPKNAPYVTWAEYLLAETVLKLIENIEKLEN